MLIGGNQTYIMLNVIVWLKKNIIIIIKIIKHKKRKVVTLW